MRMYFIVTCRTLIWGVCSVGTFMLALSAIASPKWLDGKEHTRTIKNYTVTYHDSIGLYNKCAFRRYKTHYENRCYIYARNFSEIGHASWKAGLLFMGLAIAMLAIACLFGVVSFCKQLVKSKSFVNLAGILQAFAGIFLIITVVIYPVGWSSRRVKLLCHNRYDVPKAYLLGMCSMGSAYICAIGATLACFACSLLSFVADRAVFSDKVQDEILEGKQMICII